MSGISKPKGGVVRRTSKAFGKPPRLPHVYSWNARIDTLPACPSAVPKRPLHSKLKLHRFSIRRSFLLPPILSVDTLGTEARFEESLLAPCPGRALVAEMWNLFIASMRRSKPFEAWYVSGRERAQLCSLLHCGRHMEAMWFVSPRDSQQAGSGEMYPQSAEWNPTSGARVDLGRYKVPSRAQNDIISTPHQAARFDLKTHCSHAKHQDCSCPTLGWHRCCLSDASSVRLFETHPSACQQFHDELRAVPQSIRQQTTQRRLELDSHRIAWTWPNKD